MKRHTQILFLRGLINMLALVEWAFWSLAALRYQLTTQLHNLNAAHDV